MRWRLHWPRKADGRGIRGNAGRARGAPQQIAQGGEEELVQPEEAPNQPCICEVGTGDEDGTEVGKGHKRGPQGGLVDNKEAEDKEDGHIAALLAK